MIRKAAPEDLGRIMDVLKCFGVHSLPMEEGQPIAPDADGLLEVRNEITRMDWERGFVAVHDTDIVGYAHYQVSGEVAKTTLLTVLPEYRKHGYGRKLQLARMEDAHQRGCSKMWTWCAHPESKKWYEDHFNYKLVRMEPVYHSLHFFPAADRSKWAIHYGFREYTEQSVIVCNLDDFFQHSMMDDKID